MKITILQSHRPQHLEWLGRNLRQQYWGGWLKDPQIERALKNSMCFWVIERDEDGWVNGDPLGFARVVSDATVFSTILDVFIVPERRGLGLGKQLIRTVVAHPSVAKTICVLESRDAKPLYAKFGFVHRGGDVMQRNPGPLV
jgi:GNAT superfamily N-acetyltransferase